MTTIKLLEKLSKGWRWVYRGKKAHYFIDRQSLCKKRTITASEESGLLPTSAFGCSNEFCSACYKIYLGVRK